MVEPGAFSVPGSVEIPNNHSAIDESGIPADKTAMDKRAATFVNGFLRWIDSIK